MHVTLSSNLLLTCMHAEGNLNSACIIKIMLGWHALLGFACMSFLGFACMSLLGTVQRLLKILDPPSNVDPQIEESPSTPVKPLTPKKVTFFQYRGANFK